MNVAPRRYPRELLRQAAAWRLASLLLERPRPGWRDEIEELSGEVSDQELSDCGKDLKGETEGAYHRLFGPGGMVSPREVSYCGFEDPGHLMAELASFYDGFSFRSQSEESIDHISVEAGFVGYLLLKEAYARVQGNREGARIANHARKRFLKEHVARCAAGMHERMKDSRAAMINVLLWVTQTAERGDGEPSISTE